MPDTRGLDMIPIGRQTTRHACCRQPDRLSAEAVARGMRALPDRVGIHDIIVLVLHCARIASCRSLGGNEVNETFDPLTLAEDLCEVHRIYERFSATLDATGWDTPVKGGAREWTLHETVAHLCALNGAGLASI